MDAGSYVYSIAGFRSNQVWMKDILPRLGLFFDRVHFFSDREIDEFFEQKPFAEFSNIMSDQLFNYFDRYPQPTMENLEDVSRALGDDYYTGGGVPSYYGTRSILDYCYDNKFFFYVLPGIREKFLKFCFKYHPNYFEMLKKSLLLCSLIEYIFDEYIPAFDVIRPKESLHLFSDYKIDFQNGIMKFLDIFKGGYILSEPQTIYVKDFIAHDERRLYEFLKPENLNKFNLSPIELAGEGLSIGIDLLKNIILSSVPIGVLINIFKEIKEIRDFKKEKLGFILSLTILKQITNIGPIESIPNCVVCNISDPEIEKMSEEKCMKLIYEEELCWEHMLARLDLRKRFRLWGKKLLKMMKELGDSSVLIDVPSEKN